MSGPASEGPPGDGWRVWVTREEPAGGPLSGELVAAGRVPVLEPVVHVAPLCAPDALAAPLAALGKDDWLVLTSARAVAALPDVWTRARVGVVGPATRRAAEARGLAVALESGDGTGAGLWAQLDRRLVRGARVLFPRSDLAAVPALAGVTVDAPAVYGTRARPFDHGVVARVEAAAFASPSAVDAVVEALGAAPALVALSIGPTTSAALRSHGFADVREASAPTLAALARAR